MYEWYLEKTDVDADVTKIIRDMENDNWSLFSHNVATFNHYLLFCRRLKKK